MTYRDILVQIDETPASRGRARFAAGLAGRFEAHLTGVFLKSQFLHQYMAAESLSGMSPDMIDALLTEHLKAVDKAGEAARMVFEAAAAETGATSEWLTIEGDAPTDLVDCARRSDLTVFPVSATASMGQNRHSAASLALANGGPVLVAPADPPSGSVGRNILIGWNGSREASRALHDAWPFIREADEVHVLIVSHGGLGGPEGLLQRHLERHGVTPNIIRDSSDDASAADVLRHQVKTLGADMVVMGLFGRSRLAELILGGVSNDLLAEPPCSLFLSH